MLRCFDLRCVLSDVLVGMCTEPFLPITSAFFSIYVLCVRVFGVASLYLCFNFVLDLICLRLHVFPEVCICKWRVLN